VIYMVLQLVITGENRSVQEYGPMDRTKT
jgi:hypothetical protein